MAEGQSMTTAEVVAKTMIDEHSDFLREAVRLVAAELMEAEIAAEIGAGKGEVSADRATHRNGYRPRSWETWVGELELMIPRKRSGAAYFPSFLEPRRPCEQAIVACVMEAYVNGVSTRKVDRLVSQLGFEGMSKDRVSALCRNLDKRVEAFRRRPLEGAFPYLWLDAKHLKVRSRGHVRSKALVVAYAVHDAGSRKVIGIDIGEAETEAFWEQFIRTRQPRARRCPALHLRPARGAEEGDRADPRLPLAVLHGPLRSQHGRPLPPLGARLVAAALREIFDASSLGQAKERLGEVTERFAGPLPKIAELLEAAEEDLLVFYRFPRPHWSKLRSTNPLERLNKEIGRRSDVVGIFPNDAAAIRLVGAMLIEQNVCVSGCGVSSDRAARLSPSRWPDSQKRMPRGLLTPAPAGAGVSRGRSGLHSTCRPSGMGTGRQP